MYINILRSTVDDNRPLLRNLCKALEVPTPNFDADVLESLTENNEHWYVGIHNPGQGNETISVWIDDALLIKLIRGYTTVMTVVMPIVNSIRNAFVMIGNVADNAFADAKEMMKAQRDLPELQQED